MLYKKYALFYKNMFQHLRFTDDGSHTVYNSLVNECYHSVHGARSESEHIFIRSGLHEMHRTDISVFEVGFGTGLNALLTLEEALQKQLSVHYTAVERYPIGPDLYEQLNYGATPQERDIFLQLHRAEWEREVPFCDCFSLKKTEADFTQMPLFESYDVVYYDAFSPERQPEMWGEELFAKLYDAMNEGGVLVTYCAKGVVRRTLQAVGFRVERIAGPAGGKREILRARK